MAEATAARWMCDPLLPPQPQRSSRAVECPSDIVDAIGGWTTEGIGQRYGKGYNLNVKSKVDGNFILI